MTLDNCDQLRRSSLYGEMDLDAPGVLKNNFERNDYHKTDSRRLVI